MDIRDYPTEPGIDMGDLVLNECVCGNRVFKIFATFEDYELVTYSTDAECIECGARFKAPTPLDRPGYDGDSLAW